MLKDGMKREPLIKQKVTFMNGLKSEWISIVSTVKAHEQFKNYNLAKMVGIQRSHETEELDDVKSVPNVGQLDFFAKADDTKCKNSKVIENE